MEVTSTTTTTSSTSSSSSSQLFENYEAFLELLSTQLQHQDPLDPMDTAEYTSQLVQYAGVEQQLKTNDYLESLIGLTATNAITGALGYIGREVEVAGAEAWFDGNSASWDYTLDENASDVKLVITDSDGKVVKELDGETAAGSHRLTWDGTTEDGELAETGSYTLTVTAVDGSDATVGVEITAFGVVTGVDSSSGSLLLRIGDLGVSLGDVVSVSETAA